MSASVLLLPESDPRFNQIKQMMETTKRTHKNFKPIKGYDIEFIKVVTNNELNHRFETRRQLLKNQGRDTSEIHLFHGSSKWERIATEGFKESKGNDGMFGVGVYFAADSSKSNQYVFGSKKRCNCWKRDPDCTDCPRFMLLSRVMLGETKKTQTSQDTLENNPEFDSITALPSGELKYIEYTVRKGDQAFPLYLIKYRVIN